MAFVLVVMGAVVWAAWSNALLWALVAALAWSEWFKAPEGPPTRWPKALLWLFPVPALAALIWLGKADPYDPWPTLSFLWMIWANDTGAFVVGKPLGKHKLWPSVSPGKSWEGTVGGDGDVRTRRGAGAGLGVGVVGWIDGRAVDGRRLDAKRVETPSQHERLGKPVAGSRRNHGQV